MGKSMFEPPRSWKIFGWVTRIAGVAQGVRPFLELIEEGMLKEADKMVKRWLRLAVIYFSMLAGIVILACGVILWVVDFTVIPRGMALTAGGILLIAGSALFMKGGKK